MSTILFDLDCTILNTLDDIAHCVNHVLKQHQFPLRTQEEIRSFVGNGLANLIERSLPEQAKDQKNEILQEFLPYYTLHAQDRSLPYDGILPLLDRLQDSGYTLAIVSNKNNLAVQDLKNRFFPQITHALGETDSLPRKPHPDMVWEVMMQTHSTKEATVYVGDSEVDLQTAAHAGIPCIAVSWGFRDHEMLLRAGATHLASTPEELEAMIRTLLPLGGNQQ
jgi:phosphoglycolate phosphatase